MRFRVTKYAVARLIGIAFIMGFSGEASAINIKTLYTFTGGSDGGLPTTLVADSAGNLFGTATVA
jgi:hypothetical protein